MIYDEIRQILIENARNPVEIRTSDGKKYVAKSIEHWLMNRSQIIVMNAKEYSLDYLSLRNITSLRPTRVRKRA